MRVQESQDGGVADCLNDGGGGGGVEDGDTHPLPGLGCHAHVLHLMQLHLILFLELI